MSVQTPELSVIRMLIEQTPSTESRSHFHKAFAITILEFTALLIYSLAVETDHKYCSRESSVIMSQCEASYDVTEGYDEFYCAGGCYSHITILQAMSSIINAIHIVLQDACVIHGKQILSQYW